MICPKQLLSCPSKSTMNFFYSCPALPNRLNHMLCSNVLPNHHKDLLICFVQIFAQEIMPYILLNATSAYSKVDQELVQANASHSHCQYCSYVVQDHTHMLFSNSFPNICHLLLLRPSRTRCSIMVLCQQHQNKLV